MIRYRTRNILTICLLVMSLFLTACSLGLKDTAGKSESDLQGNRSITDK